MTPDQREHEKYGSWDAAYVLGALSRPERGEYERHLADCPRCTAAVAELAPLPGLLGRVDPEVALSDPAVPPPGLEQRVLAAGARRRSVRQLLGRTRVRVGLGLAAAAAVAAAVVLPAVLHHDGPQVTSVRLSAASSSPLSAEVRLTPASWGTRVEMTCLYAGEDGPARSYALYVVDTSGRASLVSSWHAAPGQTARTAGSTGLAVGDIRTVELRGVPGRVLLTAAVGHGSG